MRDLRKIKKRFFGIMAAIIFWFLIWLFLSQKIDNKIFLPTPKDTFKAFFRIVRTKEFRKTIFASVARMMKGFLAAVLAGSCMAAVSCFVTPVKILLEPAMKLIKAVPVASFTILALLWLNSDKLSVLVSFVIVLPVIYINLLQGFEGVDKNLLEMARIYKVPFAKRFRFLYVPSVLPAFVAACKIGIGFCFKAGVAAEVIGLPAYSIGSELYKAKLYLMTDELFAWTVVIILISIFIEAAGIYILSRISRRLKNIRVFNGKSERHQKQGDSMPETGEDYFITLSGVRKAYLKDGMLKEFSLEVKKGESICIMGESGVGKTTLLRIIMGMTRPDSGSVVLPEDKKLTVVFQEDRLIEEADIYTNIYFADKSFDVEALDGHLREVRLKGLGKKRVSELSGGMKRRVAIVRAVITRPDILLLDEPFNGLDEDMKDIVAAYIRRSCKDKIVIMVTHDITEAEKMGARIYNI